MDKVIVIKNPDGSCAIVYPCPNAREKKETVTAFLNRIGKQAAGERPWRIAPVKHVPTDRTFRAAWTDDLPTPTIDIDLDKAKSLHLDAVRRERDAKWPDFDRRYLAAQRDGADLTDLKEERQRLKDAPNAIQSAVAAAGSTDELLAVTPEVLKS